MTLSSVLVFIIIYEHVNPLVCSVSIFCGIPLAYIEIIVLCYFLTISARLISSIIVSCEEFEKKKKDLFLKTTLEMLNSFCFDWF